MIFSDLINTVTRLCIGSLFIIGAFVDTSWASDGRRIALVIGNGDYADIPKLENPTRDAALIAAKLRSVGFTVDLAIDGDRASFVQRVRAFGQKARGADAALFYYAGHGLQADGGNYLLPVDAKISRIADLRHESLPLAAVIDELDHAGAKINLLILDACRDNPLTRSLARTSTRAVEIAQGLASVRRASGTFIAYATAPGQVAYDGDGQQNSPFTQALATWIDKPGLEVALMFRRVREQVVAATDGQQVPWVEEAILGNFYFQQEAPKILPAATAPAKVAPEREIEPAPLAPQRNQEVAAAWSKARDLDTRDAYQRFLDLYPNSLFTNQAIARLTIATAIPAAPPAAASEAGPPPAAPPETAEKTSKRSNSASGPAIQIIEGEGRIPGLF